MKGPEFQRCAACAAVVFPCRVTCPACGSRRLRAERSAGLGAVYSTTTLHEREGERNIALVDLDEGFRMMSTVVGVAPGDVRIGMRVRAAMDAEQRIVFHAA